MKQLAHVNFMDRNYTESAEKYKAITDLVPEITSNPVNLWLAQKNLALLYTYSDLNKAETYVDELFEANLTNPIDTEGLYFLMGNISLLSGNQVEAK